jgi:NAD-dependent dihydropyrimidine dehydrogenase PreA subunit
MAYIITEPCVGVCDTACVQVCPVNCIYGPEGYDVTNEEHLKEMREKKMQLYIHPQECIDCGACQPECPVEAIFPEAEVPEKWQQYIRINYERFGL